MQAEDQFREIIAKEQEDRLTLFLKELDADQRKSLSAPIKKLSKEYNQYGNIGGNRWGHINGTNKQRNMLQLASFVCLNQKDFERTPSPLWYINEQNLKDILTWYVPEWFSDFVNKSVSNDWFSLEYNWIMKLTEMGALQPSKELIVRGMPNMIFEHVDKKNQFKPENVLKWPQTLQEHIWYFFELESSVNWSGRYFNLGEAKSKENTGWIWVFKKYSEEGKIDRQRLLMESLLASNKNFNKTLSGWFAQLFTELEPRKEELIILQKEMLTALSSSHSKVVNTILKFFKDIIGEKKFEAEPFLDAVPVLLSAETKSIVSTSISILDKLIKKYPEQKQKVLQLLCHVFIHQDNELQKKTATIIAKSGENNDPLLKEEIGKYWNGILHESKNLLANFGPDENQQPAFDEPADNLLEPETEQLQPMPEINSLDDLFFLASQAFDNNESWHFDLLPASLVKFQHEIKGDAIARFEPALQRALKLLSGGFRSVNGNLDHMLAVFFVDYCIYLVRFFSKDAIILENQFAKFDQKDGDQIRRWLAIDSSTSYTEAWEKHYEDPFYFPFKQFLTRTLYRLRNQDALPILSTPTHLPCWIDPEKLVERLAVYQNQNQQPDNMDWQIAISRCYLKNAEKATELTEQKLSGEYRELMLFLFGKKQNIPETIRHPKIWMAAALAGASKKNAVDFKGHPYFQKNLPIYTGQLSWRSVDEEYTFDRWDYQTGKQVPAKARHKIIYIDFPETFGKKPGKLKKLISKYLPGQSSDEPLLYDHLLIKTPYVSAEHNDIRRILLMIPNNPEPMLAQILSRFLKYPTLLGENEKRIAVATLQVLYEIWDDFGEMAHLFLATCMLSADKTAASIAAEIWAKTVPANKIDTALLGKIIGLHERIEFAPLKRFTDLVIQSMYRISDLHNKKLQELIENILAELPEKPIKNLKKLLDIHSELVAINKTNPGQKIIGEKLER